MERTAPSTNRLTFADMQIRVANYLGLADLTGGAPAVPTDAYDLDIVKQRINDGMRRLLNASENWRFLSPLYSLTFNPDGDGPLNVNGEAYRYYMPKAFHGQMISHFVYSGTSTPRRDITVTSDSEIMNLRATGEVSGDPYLYALRPLPPDAPGDQGGWEAIFYPDPSSAYTVHARLHLWPDKLVDDEDVFIGGPAYDDALLKAALAEAEAWDNDGVRGVAEQAYQQALQRALAVNRAAAHRRVGTTGERGRNDWYDGVDTYVNLDGTTHTFTI